jgi:hypothetical protein
MRQPGRVGVCYHPNDMPRGKLAVVTHLGIAAVAFVVSSRVTSRSGFSLLPSHESAVAARQGQRPAAASDVKPVDPVDPQKREAVANEFVEQKLRLWQERMNMPDWNIQAVLVRSNELEPNTLGNVRWDLEAKEATIHVMSSYDYRLPFQAMLDDMEVTIVHELVHIQLASLPRSEASRGQEEHAVIELTNALLKLAKSWPQDGGTLQ